MAWFTAWLLTPYLKEGKSIDPEGLLPNTLRKKRLAMTKKDAQKELEDLKKRLKID